MTSPLHPSHKWPFLHEPLFPGECGGPPGSTMAPPGGERWTPLWPLCGGYGEQEEPGKGQEQGQGKEQEQWRKGGEGASLESGDSGAEDPAGRAGGGQEGVEGGGEGEGEQGPGEEGAGGEQRQCGGGSDPALPQLSDSHGWPRHLQEEQWQPPCA